MRPTIREIAKKAGVDPSTVSRALSGRAEKCRISAPTVRRIEAAAKKLGYRPNLYARYMRTQRTHSVGLLVTDLDNPFYGALAGAVEAHFAGEGYVTIIAASWEDPKRQITYLGALRSRPVDGLIVVPAGTRKERAVLQGLVASSFPFVVIDRLLPGLKADFVVTESRKGGAALVKELARLGCRRIAMVGGPKGIWTAEERLAGFRQGMKTAGLKMSPFLIRSGPFSVEHGRKAAKELLAMGNPPDGFVAANNKLLIGVLEVLVEEGPRFAEVPVAGFDGVPFASLLGRPLFVADQSPGAIGTAAAKLLSRQIENGRRKTEVKRLPVKIRKYGG
jgi:LacI family transcriptional regulator